MRLLFVFDCAVFVSNVWDVNIVRFAFVLCAIWSFRFLLSHWQCHGEHIVFRSVVEALHVLLRIFGTVR